MSKRIFIAATSQNDGKTTMSLGLIQAFRKKLKHVGFIKPIGQRYLIEQGYKIDEDSILIEEICDINCRLKDMSPVAIEKNFTERYIRRGTKEKIKEQIQSSFERVAKGRSMVVIEGTGHAGVGSVFDWCNASVAKLLKSKVILVTIGGIGRPIDEIMLNRALFEKEGVEIIGVIVNKVRQSKYEKINTLVRKGFERKGIDVLGVLPYRPFLSTPTMKQITEELGGKLICGEANLSRPVENIIIGAMEPHKAITYVKDKSLIITGGDREDMMLAAISVQIYKPEEGAKVSGFVLTGGLKPHSSIVRLLEKTNIPTLSVNMDTYTAAKRIHDRTVKIQPGDQEKIKMVTEMVQEYVDIDRILDRL